MMYQEGNCLHPMKSDAAESANASSEDEFISEEALNDIAQAQEMWYTVPM